MNIIGVSINQMVKEILLPAFLPAIPTVIVLYLLQEIIDPFKVLSIIVLAGIGFVVYAIGYLSFSASEIERQTCRSWMRSTIQFAETCFKRT